MVATRDGFLAVKGLDLENTKWEERLWRLDSAALKFFHKEGPHVYMGCFKFDGMLNVQLDDKKSECNFEVDGTTVRLRARTREEANGWYSSIMEAIYDTLKAARAATTSIVGDVGEQPVVTERVVEPPPPAQLQEARREAIEPVTADAALRNGSLRNGSTVKDSLNPKVVQESPAATVGQSTVELSIDAVQTTVGPSEDDPDLVDGEDLFADGNSLQETKSGVASEDQDMIKMQTKNVRIRDTAVIKLRTLHKTLDKPLNRIRDRILTHTQQGKKELVAQFFKQMDCNCDGQLDLRELKHVFRTVFKFPRNELPDKDLETLFQVIAGERGEICVNEFESSIMDGCASPCQRITTKGKGRESTWKVTGRLTEMYKEHALREAKKTVAKQEQEDAELEMCGGHKRLNQDDALILSERLYMEKDRLEESMIEKRGMYDELQRRTIQANAAFNRPTKKTRPVYIEGAAEASNRLYRDAEQRMDRQAQKLEHLTYAQDMWFAENQIHHPKGGDGGRCEMLYKDAEIKERRRRDKYDQKLDKEDDQIRAGQIPCLVTKNGRAPDQERINKLHQDHQVHLKNRARALTEKTAKEEEQANITQEEIKKKFGRDDGRRPSMSDDPRSPRSLQSEKRREIEERQQAERRKARATVKPVEEWKCAGKLDLAGASDHLLNTCIQPLQMRLGYNAETDCIWDEDNRPLSHTLKDVVKIYRDAQKNCEASDGYLALCNRSSERLYRQRLQPEFEGWSKNFEPDPIMQVEEDLDALMSSAKKAHAHLKQLVVGTRTWNGGVSSHPEGVPIALFAYDNGLKRRDHARAKARFRNGPSEHGSGCYKHLLDLSRLLLVFSSCDMLQSGLDQILRSFEVVCVKNFFNRPARCGLRFIEVSVVVQVINDDDEPVPHVCELRLEELCFHTAQEKAHKTLENFTTQFHNLYDRANRCTEALSAFVRSTLVSPTPSHDIKVFRCHFAKKYGSTISGWRKEVGSKRFLTFTKFREICQKMSYGERAVEFWEELDPGMGGCICLFDWDQEAVSILLQIRARLVALADTGHNGPTSWALSESPGNLAEPKALFARLSFFTKPSQVGRLVRQEFRTCMKPLSLTHVEADKIFSYLDVNHMSPQSIGVPDIAWLMSLPSLMDIEAVMMSSATAPTMSEGLRHVAWARATGRHAKRGQVLRWSVFKETNDFARTPNGLAGFSRFQPSGRATPPLTEGADSDSDGLPGRSQRSSVSRTSPKSFDYYHESDEDEENEDDPLGGIDEAF
jgi:hypothetical protein